MYKFDLCSEDLRFVQGAGEFVDDLTRPDLLHAAILRSQFAHGRIVRIDPSTAKAMPGVQAVITASEIGAVPRIPFAARAAAGIPAL